jgi:NAD dependent epimerase/dehydratase family enzyme
MGRTIGRPSYFRVPEFALRTLLGEKASVVLLSQRAIPERLLGEGFKFTFETAEDALNDLLK